MMLQIPFVGNRNFQFLELNQHLMTMELKVNKFNYVL